MNSKIILCKNIKLDKEYRNVLNYSLNDMLSLCNTNMIASAENYSFIRDNQNSISVNFSYETCLKANYIAFQNPRYSNKWFFAFIDNVVYNTDASTQINFIVDTWSTWFNAINVSECFVIREHVNDDTIGLHTVPENVETGTYISNSVEKIDTLNSFKYVMQVTEWAPGSGAIPANELTDFGGVPAPGNCYIFDTPEQMNEKIQQYQTGKADAIINTYMIPSAVISDTIVEDEFYYLGQKNPETFNYNTNKPTSLNGYTPKNKKLLTYPYIYLALTNNNGSTNILEYEYFSSNQATFLVKGVPTPGGSIKCIPLNYKGASENEIEGLMCGKFPTLGWSSDPYTNWLSQNAVNLGVGLISNLISLGGSLLMSSTVGTETGTAVKSKGDTGGMIGSVMSIANTIGTLYQHSLVPNTAQGNTNGGDINTCSGNNTFILYHNTIKKEYAQIIDDYFTRFGYKVNRLKVPNITGRPIFNYIQISSTDDIGFGEVPNLFMEQINEIARRGTTIWHSHNNIGNYNLDNTIQ